MDIYHAVGGPNIIEAMQGALRPGVFRPTPNILISFPFLRGSIHKLLNLKQQGKINRLFLDAGTFTLNVYEKSTDPKMKSRFEEYAQFVKLYGNHFDLIASYDEDFNDPQLNQILLEQMQIMMEWNIDVFKQKILPVVHEQNDKSIREFKDYVDMGYNYIAIGSKPGLKKGKWEVIQQFIAAKASSGINVSTHIFGNMSYPKLVAMQPSSTDASSFAKAAAFNIMYYWNQRTHDLEKVLLMEPTEESSSSKNATRLNAKHHEFLISTFGYEPDDLIAYSDKRSIVNMYGLCLMEQALNANRP